MYVIPITPAALDLIEVLNDGVRPAFEDEATFYVYRGKDEHAAIVTKSEILELDDEEVWAQMNILHRD